jgi:hypothetical protein
MTETPGTFTHRDVEELTLALSKMAVHNHLPREQRDLLLSIFAAAKGHVEVGEDDTKGTISGAGVKRGGVIEGPEGKEVEALRNQLLNAYMPGGPPTGGSQAMVSPPKGPPPPPPPPPAGQ